MQLITITGNVGKVPVKKKVDKGERITFPVACKSRVWSSEEETWVERTTWYNVGTMSTKLVNYLCGDKWKMPKGSRVTVCGELSVGDPYLNEKTEVYENSLWINAYDVAVQYSEESSEDEDAKPTKKAVKKPEAAKQENRKRKDWDEVDDDDESGLE